MTKRERDARKTAVKAARARGLSWREIVRLHGVSERQGRRWLAQEAAARLPVDPDAAVTELTTYLAAAVSDYALLAASTSNDAVKVAALKARDEAVLRRFRAMQELGLLPSSFQAWDASRELVVLIRRFGELLQQHGVDEPVIDDFLVLTEQAETEQQRPHAVA